MKNKKIIYAIIGIAILISMVVIIAIISNKPMPIDHTPKESTSILEELKKKYPDKKYLKLTGGEILNENTCFNKYSFINNNSISNILIFGALVQTLFITRLAYKITNNKYGHEVYRAEEQIIS